MVVPNSLGSGTGSPEDGSVLFFGYINKLKPFTSVQLLDSAAFDTFGYDDFVAGNTSASATPEPGSTALLAAGLLALAVSRRGRKKKPQEMSR